MIRNARLIAVEGTHGTGKTTLVHALASRLKEAQTHVGVQEDAARVSPLVEDVMVHGRGEIDLSTEIHLLASQLAGEQSLARHHELVLCDKSAVSVIAYTRLYVAAMDQGDEALFQAMGELVQRYAGRYDGIFFLADLYEIHETLDPYRPVNLPLKRERAGELIRAELEAADVRVHDVPTGLVTEQKVEWILTRISDPQA